MADPIKAGDGVEVDTRPNPELSAWTKTLYNHLLEDPARPSRECIVGDAKYNIFLDYIGGDEPQEERHHFVSIAKSDLSGDGTSFFVTDEDQVDYNTFAEGKGNGLPFLKEVCRQLGVSLAPATAAVHGVAEKVVGALS